MKPDPITDLVADACYLRRRMCFAKDQIVKTLAERASRLAGFDDLDVLAEHMEAFDPSEVPTTKTGIAEVRSFLFGTSEGNGSGNLAKLAEVTASSVRSRLRWCNERWWICARTDKYGDVPGFWSVSWGKGEDSVAKDVLRQYDFPVTSSNVDGLLRFWRNPLAAKPEEFDAHPWLLGVQNGVIDLHTGRLVAADPGMMLTRHAPVAYREGAECPNFLKHLDRLFEGCHPDSAKWLQEAIGISLIGLVTDKGQFYVHLYGPPGNGKGTFYRALGGALGNGPTGLMASIEASELAGSGNHPTWLTDLKGARIAVTEEISKCKPALMKQLTGGDNITARRLYENNQTWAPTHSFFTSANEPLQTTTINGIVGMSRRYRRLNSGAKLRPEEVDKNWENLLASEAEGILAWAVVGCLIGVQEPEGLPWLPGMREEAEEDVTQLDWRAQWFEQCVEAFGPDCPVTTWEAIRNSASAWRRAAGWGDKWDDEMGKDLQSYVMGKCPDAARVSGGKRGRHLTLKPLSMSDVVRDTAPVTAF